MLKKCLSIMCVQKKSESEFYLPEILRKKTGMIEVRPRPLSRTARAPDIFAACLVLLSRLEARGRDLFFEVIGLPGVL